ncbi:hypothetical protein AB0I49_32710 [Streptomyces sp. NPDC050617]|uniref:hypothetical protein n=1 Tax=Streptomyces sp. NPDC050617 TaxID=3154628 RepID=UPI003441197D
MITVSQLAQLDIDALETFADDWAVIHRKIKTARTEFHDDVVRALRRDHWRGEGGKAAQRHCERMVLDLDALDAEVRGLRSYMDVEADGKHGRDGLKGHQRTVAELIQQALDAGMTVNDTGQVTWTEMRAPGPLSPAEKRHVEERDEKAAGLERKIEAELRAATETDAQLARDLKVIFGTPDNFETESRKHGIDGAGLHDWWVFQQLEAVEAGMRTIEHWGHASELLSHYLHGDGKSYEVDPDTMLDDVPAFRHDVDRTLDGVRKKPDGTFSTPWTTTAPKIKDGGSSMDWYYALNHFQYRTVGEKRNGHIAYRVEVKKRYDWGIPSEHRRNVSGAHGLFNFEQADIARLNSTGLARDFDVHGRSREMAAK